jgi:hypothetical protein
MSEPTVTIKVTEETWKMRGRREGGMSIIQKVDEKEIHHETIGKVIPRPVNQKLAPYGNTRLVYDE